MSDDKMTPVVMEAARRYGVTLEWFYSEDGSGRFYNSETIRGKKLPRDFSWGPQGLAGFSMMEKYVYACDAAPGDVFHEFMHVILGNPGLKLCEGFLLMPFEWEFAKALAKEMGSDGNYFLREVDSYQNVTEVDRGPMKGRTWMRSSEFTSAERDTTWWKRGIARAQRLGLLDNQLAPTYRYPNWIGSGVAIRAKWGTDLDHRFA